MRSLVTVLLLFPLAAHAQRTTEEITVERILIDARVTDSYFDPVLGLGPEDFTVKVDGKTAKVESVMWVPDTAAAREVAEALTDQEIPEDAPPPSRLFIWFVQTDFAREPSRVGGQLHFLPYAQKMIDALEPGDRVAVFSHDSHMKFHLDFTDDKTEIENALKQALTTAEPERPRMVPNPSLASRLNREEMFKAYKPEVAFVHIANAVRNIPGPKTMVLFGWGLGRRTGSTVSMDPKYPIAKYALESSRVTVFALDMSIADYHDLEIGLQKTAADTGGFYAKTHIFPQMAIERLQKTLSGHYELEVRKPGGLKRGMHTIDVQVVKRRGGAYYVMARSSYVDRD
jgi:VWFA-related protein